MNYSREKLVTLQNFAFFGLAAVMTTVVAGVIFVDTYVEPSPYKVLDWAINYSGGFVRRGLTGEALSWVSRTLSVDLIHLIFVVRIIVSCGATIFMFLCFHKLGRPRALTLAFFSPFFAIAPLSSWQIVGKKEFLLIFLFSACCYFIIGSKDRARQGNIILFLAAILPVLILSHEIMAFLGGWIVALAIVLELKKSDFVKLALVLLTSLLAIGAATLFKGTEENISAICGDLTYTTEFHSFVESCATRSPVEFLGRSVDEEISANFRIYAPEMLPTIPLAFLLILIGILPLGQLLSSYGSTNFHLAILLGVTSTLPLFIVAYDWGRFLIANLIMAILVSMVAWDKFKRTSIMDVHVPFVLLLAYASCWSINFSGDLIGKGFFVELFIRFSEGR